MPTMNRKNGKIRSVGVQPCQAAWSSGQYWDFSPHSPGLLTRIMARIVAPRKTSSERRRPVPTFVAADSGAEGGEAYAIDDVEYIRCAREILATC